jgi:hypothetical protein
VFHELLKQRFYAYVFGVTFIKNRCELKTEFALTYRHTLTSVGRQPILLLLATCTAMESHRMVIEIVQLLDNRCSTRTYIRFVHVLGSKNLI